MALLAIVPSRNIVHVTSEGAQMAPPSLLIGGRTNTMNLYNSVRTNHTKKGWGDTEYLARKGKKQTSSDGTSPKTNQNIIVDMRYGVAYRLHDVSLEKIFPFLYFGLKSHKKYQMYTPLRLHCWKTYRETPFNSKRGMMTTNMITHDDYILYIGRYLSHPVIKISYGYPAPSTNYIPTTPDIIDT